MIFGWRHLSNKKPVSPYQSEKTLVAEVVMDNGLRAKVQFSEENGGTQTFFVEGIAVNFMCPTHEGFERMKLGYSDWRGPPDYAGADGLRTFLKMMEEQLQISTEDREEAENDVNLACDVLDRVRQLVKTSEAPSKLPSGACCDNERRSFDGGCLNCGDPCL